MVLNCVEGSNNFKCCSKTTKITIEYFWFFFVSINCSNTTRRIQLTSVYLCVNISLFRIYIRIQKIKAIIRILVKKINTWWSIGYSNFYIEAECLIKNVFFFKINKKVDGKFNVWTLFMVGLLLIRFLIIRKKILSSKTLNLFPKSNMLD